MSFDHFFVWSGETLKKRLNDSLKDLDATLGLAHIASQKQIIMMVNWTNYQSLNDLTNPLTYVCNWISVLVLTNGLWSPGHMQLDISPWYYQSTWPQLQADNGPCSYQPF